jgi:8-oxo-dGTP diphosphatase
VGLSETVRAGGGVIWRRGEDGSPEVLLIYRPRYLDWSFPKGKVKQGESDEEAALREIEEEVGIRAELGPELPSTRYRDARGRDKLVRYWAVELPDDQEPTHGDGVAGLRWLPLEAVPEELSWDRDLDVLAGLQGAIG